MKSVFYCQKCKRTFQAKGKKVKWDNPFYGPCWKRVARCPECKKEADESMPVRKRKDDTASSSGNPSCTTGTCPFVN